MHFLKQAALTVLVAAATVCAGVPNGVAARPLPPGTAAAAQLAAIDFANVGSVNPREAAHAARLQRIEGLLRTVAKKDAYGRDKPNRGRGAGGWNDPVRVAVDIVKELEGLQELEAQIDQDFVADEVDANGRGLSAELKQRQQRAKQDAKARANEFRRLTRELEHAVRGNGRADIEASLDALNGFLAQFPATAGLPFDAKDVGRVLAKPHRTEPRLDFGGPQGKAATEAESAKAIAPPGAADLAATDEVQLTPAIRALAESLGDNPVRIRDWVANNIEVLPTFGSLQGSELTRISRQGNPTDQASLLIALLRSAGVPARFVHGTVELPAASVVNWIGARNVDEAVDVMQKGGIPTGALYSGGRIATVVFEHVWVEAWVDFEPSRGAVNRGGDTWVPLDASFKRHTIHEPIVLDVPLDADGISDAFIASATTGPGGSLTGLDLGILHQGLNDYFPGVAERLEQSYPNAKGAELFRHKRIVPAETAMLEGVLPYRVRATGARHAALPDSLKHFVTVNLFAQALDWQMDSPTLTQRIPLSRIGVAPLGVHYAPATPGDAQGIQSYVESNARTMPVYLFNVVPQLQLDGTTLASGGAVQMGTTQLWDAYITDPHGRSVRPLEPYRVTAGSEVVFSVEAAGITPKMMEANAARLPPTASVPLREGLHLAGLNYWLLHRLFERQAADTWGGTTVPIASVGSFSAPMTVRYFFGVPRTGYMSSYQADVKSLTSAVSNANDEHLRYQVLQGGSMGSIVEGETWSMVFGQPVGRGLSAVAVLGAANDQGVPIYTITPENAATVMPLLRLGGDAKAEIQNAIDAGYHVTAAESDLNFGGWSGTGYVIFDPETGAGIYRLDGGLNGGVMLAICLGKAILFNCLVERMMWKLYGGLIDGIAKKFPRFAAALRTPIGRHIVPRALGFAQRYIMFLSIHLTMTEIAIALATDDLEGLLLAFGIYLPALLACSYNGPCPPRGFGGPDGDRRRPRRGIGGGGFARGNPVFTAQGVKHQIELDYQAEGAFPLEFERIYTTGTLRNGHVGVRWRGTYERQLEFAPAASEATANGAPPAVLVVFADGSFAQFDLSNGAYVPPADMPTRLARLDNGARWEHINAADEIETYDRDGRLLSIRNRAGLAHTLTRNDDGFVVAVRDTFGRELKFTYDDAGQLDTLTDPAQRVYRYAHDDHGNLVSVTYPDNSTRRYHYEDVRPELLTGITDERGIRLATWKYDHKARAIESSYAGGADHFRFAYGAGHTTTETDPLGATRTYEHVRIHDGSFRVAKVSQPCSSCSLGGTATALYDGNGFPRQQTDHNGNVTTFVFEARGLEGSRTEAANTPEQRTITTTWHPTFDLPVREVEAAASSGQLVTEYAYDPVTAVPLTKKIIADGQTRTWTFEHNPHGQLTKVDGPRTDVVDIETYTYDAQGNRATMTNAVGHVTRYTEYDAHGRLIEQVDPSGKITRYDYDLRGRLLSTTSRETPGAPAQTTRYDYLPNGLIERLTLPDASFITYGYDEAGRLVSTTDAQGRMVKYTLNANGDRVAEETFDADGTRVAVMTRSIDTLGRLESETGAEPTEVTTHTYDPNGNETTLTDPNEHRTTNQYDALDRLTSVTDPARGTIGYTYDARDNLRSVTDPRNLVTRYGYNGFDELTRLESPDTGVTQYQYDAAGNLVSQTDARQVTATYRYDALNRVTQIDYPAVPNVAAERLSFSYDEPTGAAGAKGRLTTARDRAGTTTYQYDADGRVTRKTQTLGTDAATTKTLAYGYDEADGRLSDLALPSGAQIRYRYGADGRVVTLEVNGQVVVREIEYFAFGEPKAWRYGANGRYARSFDADGRVASHTVGRETRTLGYDAASRITRIEDAGTDRPKWRYGYDALDRITGATNEATTGPLAGLGLAWTYDATGNRTQQTQQRDGATTATPYTIDPVSNRLTGVGGVARSYDAVGNTTNDGTQTSIYSGRNRLVEVRQGGAVVGRYTHNAFGERVCKATNGAACPTRNADGTGTLGSGSHLQFVYDEDGHLVGEYDATGALVAEHVWLGDTPVATLKPASSAATHGGTVAGNVTVYYVHPDHLDTPRAIVNAREQVVWRWDSGPFGDAEAQESPEGLGSFAYALRLPGQYADSESGTSYNYFRQFEPATGRYRESDPIGLDGGLNTYLYVGAEPLRSSDSTGLAAGVRAWQVGAFDQLKRKELPGDGLQIHHVAQGAIMRCLCPGFDYRTGPAIAVPDSVHARVPVSNPGSSFGGSPRQALARDIRALRRGGAPRGSLIELIELNKAKYPNCFRRPRR